MIFDFKKLRPSPKYPTYPAYHAGDYLEDYFYNFYIRNKQKFDKKNRTLIPVSWTTLYVDGTTENIQSYLDALDQNIPYFAVSQHDDGIRQKLPKNTIHFGAGGLGGGLPIPLICSPIPQNLIGDVPKDKNIFCSFIGSMTHPIRGEIYSKYANNYKFTFNPPRMWSQSVGDANLKQFIDVTKNSVYALASRGYGLSSFRLYEILQLGAIPVYVSDKHWLPFQKYLDWNKFCVIIKESQINSLEQILLNISPQIRNEMLIEGRRVWNEYFTLEKTCERILEIL